MSVPEVVRFPKTLAAARKQDTNLWELADAIWRETGDPTPHVSNSKATLALMDLKDELSRFGFEYKLETLEALRSTACAFPGGYVREGGVSFEVHRRAGKPAVLKEMIEHAKKKDKRLTLAVAVEYLQNRNKINEPESGRPDSGLLNSLTDSVSGGSVDEAGLAAGDGLTDTGSGIVGEERPDDRQNGKSEEPEESEPKPFAAILTEQNKDAIRANKMAQVIEEFDLGEVDNNDIDLFVETAMRIHLKWLGIANRVREQRPSRSHLRVVRPGGGLSR